ncbi:MAG TPA: hypothetical protein PKK94_02885, partial [Leptospiraceae bacterium]|nr:hypothetical protein [Leptospiraceae bacterium]
GLMPISAEFLLSEYASKNSETLKTRINSFASELQSQNVKDLFTKGEDITYKALVTNTTVRAAIESVMNAFMDASIIKDSTFRSSVAGILYGVGDMMNVKAGFSDTKSPETVFKELIINLEKYYTVGGSSYTTEYSNASFSSEFAQALTELYTEVKKLIITPTSVTKDTTNPTNTSEPLILANELAKNLALFDFPATISGVDQSLKDLIRLDFKGRDRSYSNNGSIEISALETLVFVLALVDSFGYIWENAVSCNANAGCTNQITGSTGGVMRVGDTLWALQSTIRSSDTLNFKNILNNNATSRAVYKGGVELSTNTSKAVDINAEVLRLLEAGSLGAVKSITAGGTDPVYSKTIPWVMNWIKKVVYEGYGPYYNKNKKNSAGQFLNPDGSVYNANASDTNAKYVSSWKTADYKICVDKSGGNRRWVGLGGYESNGTTIPHPTGLCNAGTNTPPSSAVADWSYTIYEMSKTDAERAVETDEEAFYKNFQWLLYEKRFVVIIPAKAKLDASLTFEEALFIVAVGNGLKGMMGLKPNCGQFNTLSDCGAYNGVWNSDVSAVKSMKLKQYDALGTSPTTANFSPTPGDSVLLLEGWGYGAAGTNPSLGLAFVLPNTAYNLLVPTPSLVFGMIPPAISQNFDALERLGFLTDQVVTPSQVPNNWDKRNKLAPVIAALAKTFDDQVDVANSKNPFTLLTSLTKILARPNVLTEQDPDSFNTAMVFPACTGGCPPTIPSIRIQGSSSTTGIRNPSALSSEYYPKKNLRPMISVLSENQRKFQDGMLNLVAKTDLLTNTIRTLAFLGSSSRTAAREKIFNGLYKIMDNIRIDSDQTSTTLQYNLQTYIKEVRDRIAVYPDSRNTSDLTGSSWDGVSDSVAFIRDYLAKASPYTLVGSIDFSLGMLADIPPSSEQITSLLNVVSVMFTDTAGNRKYRVLSMMTGDLPVILQQVAPYGRNVFALAGSLGKPGSYFSYLEQKMTIGSYRIRDLLDDVNRFCTAEMVQTKLENSDALFYSSGKLLKLFADVYQFGRKLDAYGFPFADNLNVDDNASDSLYWNRLNMLLSTKN